MCRALVSVAPHWQHRFRKLLAVWHVSHRQTQNRRCHCEKLPAHTVVVCGGCQMCFPAEHVRSSYCRWCLICSRTHGNRLRCQMRPPQLLVQSAALPNHRRHRTLHAMWHSVCALQFLRTNKIQARQWLATLCTATGNTTICRSARAHRCICTLAGRGVSTFAAMKQRQLLLHTELQTAAR